MDHVLMILPNIPQHEYMLSLLFFKAISLAIGNIFPLPKMNILVTLFVFIKFAILSNCCFNNTFLSSSSIIVGNVLNVINHRNINIFFF